MKQLSLHKVKPDQGRVPADVSGGDECPGSCLSDIVSVSVSISVVCFHCVLPEAELKNHITCKLTVHLQSLLQQNKTFLGVNENADHLLTSFSDISSID